MLKALELQGFKSFADKTRFEFPPGITVVVGPNGSGKSNIVDALKWVLGEQSAKSLRGKDMSDVIFKGSSGPGSRKPAGSASATLVLDNADGRLLYDSPEVSVTRRVYRSGESEYLINGAACRLKDIRELFRGTGIGTDAYSLIEQGKVERMLQASPKDRRAIFEEAAGISRFKAKKIEAERRLERVQANLVRLADIVEEVGSRYRSIKNQASRAARYRELTTRLQELRTWVGFKDFRAFADRIDRVNADLQQQAALVEEQEKVIASAQSETSQLESQIETLTAEINQQQEIVSQLREEIVQLESRIEAETRRVGDLNERIGQNSLQLDSHTEKANRLQTQLDVQRQEHDAADAERQKAGATLESLVQAVSDADGEIARLKQQDETSRQRHAALQVDASSLGKSLAAVVARLDATAAEQSRLESAATQVREEIGLTAAEIDSLRRQRAELTAEAESNDSALMSARQSTDSMEELIAARQQELAEQKSELAGVVQRSRVIAELEKKLESANAGIHELLKLGKNDPSLGIVGVVADLIQVNIRHAALIDAALGPVAQFVVTRDDTLVRKIALGEVRVPGRVGILQQNDTPAGAAPTLHHQLSDFADRPGVVGSADSLIDVIASGSANLIARMLGDTWIVQSLADALALRDSGHAAIRMVTLDGELLQPDGVVMAGSKSSVQGIVSRRSELRALAGQQQQLQNSVAELDRTLEELKQELAAGKKSVQKLLAENQKVAGQLSENTAALNQAEKVHQRLAESQSSCHSGLESVVALVLQLTESVASDTARHHQLESELSSLAAARENNLQQIERLTTSRNERERELTVAKVRLARCEQQLSDLQNRRTDLDRQLSESAETTRQLQVQIGADQQAIGAAGNIVHESSRRLDELSAERERAGERLEELVGQRSAIDRSRKQHAATLATARSELKSGQEMLNECRLKIGQYRMERDQLAARLMEDYQIDVATMEATETPEQVEDREKVDAEITSLRQKIGAIGNVNLAALTELEELETRYQHLDSQYQDLVAARDSLLKIIHRINNDSRKLFSETLEAIRLNFQKLFRQTFGGGQADIVLEGGVDVLEAGVDIIATPPGKPKFSNSLLSGGEKALTAVSLLMAIFQFRPSPFCVLDEVDAPFDEANIGRFIDVLKSFLGWTRFVIVTHSKKTMTAATTLYGVTMQESGVSKRVSVKFEDVSEDGQISEDAVRRTPSTSGPDDDSESGQDDDVDEKRTVA